MFFLIYLYQKLKREKETKKRKRIEKLTLQMRRMLKMFSKKIFMPVILFLIIVFFSALFIVKQTEQALVLQFGDPIRII